MLDGQLKPIQSQREPHSIGAPIPTTTTPCTRSEVECEQLWLQIHLLQFSLEILIPGNCNQRACVLVEGQDTRPKIVLANNHAVSLGVRVGMPLGAARILGDLVVVSRDEHAERQVLERLCAWACQFTPIVSATSPDGLLLEIKGSLKLFGGVNVLCNRVRRGLRDLGYRASIAIAPTPTAAIALARAGRQQMILSKEELPSALGCLPLDVLPLEPKQLTVLNSIGARSIGDCLRLPRGGFARRISPKVVDIFSRLIGRSPDPRVRFELPKVFQSDLELPWETTNAQSLSVAGERLLHELSGYLRACASETRRLRWSLNYTDGHAVHFQTDLTQPSSNQAHFALLLREQLSHIQFTGKINQIALCVNEICPRIDDYDGDLFKRGRERTSEDWPSFLDRLRARLGKQAVKGLECVSDHRPEYAWRWSNVHSQSNMAVRTSDNFTSDVAERPLWLMRRPIRLRTRQGKLNINGRLRLLEERERIETGWWDGKPVERDYFVAANPSGARLWIYRELSGDKNWYLHGIFE